MKRAVPFLACLLLPWTLLAQGNHFTAATTQEVPIVAQANVPSGNDDGSSVEPATRIDVAANQDLNTSQQPNAKPNSSSTPRGESTPKIPGSMVGYIDNPIPESEVRIRFDAGFHDNAPDRAEFFYAQCGCNGGDAPGPKPGLVADLNFQQLYLRAEYAPISRFSIFTEVPVRWIQPQVFVAGTGTFPNQAGLSDVLAGFKFAAVASSSQYLTFQFQASFPSGDASKGLGTNHYSVEPELLYYQRISDRVALEAMVGDTHPIGGSTALVHGVTTSFAGDVFSYGVGPSYALYKGERVQFVPVIELVGWSVLSGLRTDPASISIVKAGGSNIINLKGGARTFIGAHNSIYIGYGHQIAHDVWYKEILRVEYRYTF